MKIYLVVKSHPAPASPEVQGVFSTEARAIEACREWTDVYTDLDLDVELPRELVFQPTYHPLSKKVTMDGGKTWEPDTRGAPVEVANQKS